MDEEIWKPIPGYEGLYEASTHGRICRLTYRTKNSNHPYESPRILKPRREYGSYKRVTLYKDNVGKNHRWQRVILLTFRGPPPEGWVDAAHLDGNPANNALSNLEWQTRKKNAQTKRQHGTQQLGSRLHNAKLTEQAVIQIRALRAAGMTQAKIAETFGVTNSAIACVLKGRTWSHVAALATSTEKA